MVRPQVGSSDSRLNVAHTPTIMYNTPPLASSVGLRRVYSAPPRKNVAPVVANQSGGCDPTHPDYNSETLQRAATRNRIVSQTLYEQVGLLHHAKPRRTPSSSSSHSSHSNPTPPISNTPPSAFRRFPPAPSPSAADHVYRAQLADVSSTLMELSSHYHQPLLHNRSPLQRTAVVNVPHTDAGNSQQWPSYSSGEPAGNKTVVRIRPMVVHERARSQPPPPVPPKPQHLVATKPPPVPSPRVTKTRSFGAIDKLAPQRQIVTIKDETEEEVERTMENASSSSEHDVSDLESMQQQQVEIERLIKSLDASEEHRNLEAQFEAGRLERYLADRRSLTVLEARLQLQLDRCDAALRDADNSVLRSRRQKVQTQLNDVQALHTNALRTRDQLTRALPAPDILADFERYERTALQLYAEHARLTNAIKQADGTASRIHSSLSCFTPLNRSASGMA